MKIKLRLLVFSIILSTIYSALGQDIAVYQQFNGNYDFSFVGNTMNLLENNGNADCETLVQQSSSAELSLATGETVTAAYLYWAGAGLGDFNVKLNGIDIIAQRTFSEITGTVSLNYFSAFTDVTSLVQATGNGTYTLSELDISQDLLNVPGYCGFRTNFAGWAIVIVYESAGLPLNQINIYDGLESIPPNLNITLNSINVIDNLGAKIGFIAWEGDNALSVNETLRLNGNILTNSLNPPNNAFNGTNTVTGSNALFNMDLDIYDIQNNINIGDTSALIQLTSGQDVVMINVIVTKLNNELPDATITASNFQQSCDSRTLSLDYTVNNFNCTDVLPTATRIAFYADNQLVGQSATTTVLPIGGSENGQITLFIPNSIPDTFTLRLVVDDIGTGQGVVAELVENNNTFTTPITLWISPEFNTLPDLFSCVASLTNVTFDFSNYANLVKVNPSDVVQFFNTLNDATSNINPILNSNNFIVNVASTTIYVRIDNANCFSITSFNIDLKLFPAFNPLEDIFVCRESETSSFNFSEYSNLVVVNPSDSVLFFNSLEDANNNVNPITNTDNYIPNSTPKTIYVSIYNGFCYSYTSFTLDYHELPGFNTLPKLVSCNEGLTKGIFDFSSYASSVLALPTDTFLGFYTSYSDAVNILNPIAEPSNYLAPATPMEVFIRIENQNCYIITSFMLEVINCPPKIYNWVSDNNDTANDTFEIDGLRDVFLNFELEIYNRWGRLIWTGNNNTPDWEGESNNGYRWDSNKLPSSVYYYVLNLNDKDYPNPYVGWIYYVTQ